MCLSTNVWLHRKMEHVVTSLTSLQNCKPHLVLSVISFFWIQSYVWESFGEPREDPGGSRGQPPRPNDVFRLGQVRCQNSPASGPFPRRISSSTEVQVLNSRANPAHPYHRFGTATSWEFDLTWLCVHFFASCCRTGNIKTLLEDTAAKGRSQHILRFTGSPSVPETSLISFRGRHQLESWTLGLLPALLDQRDAEYPSDAGFCHKTANRLVIYIYISLYIPLISPLLLLYPHYIHRYSM